ncbi:aromatic amino acid lyase [Actinospica robiniae]|uniref:aromatic amino acid lyase n=1 Tax=Actinospica robiniae TaxID=304901 RepID=UPI00054FCB02|nr:aromatic amino acid lyase [Actinospica robiniae]
MRTVLLGMDDLEPADVAALARRRAVPVVAAEALARVGASRGAAISALAAAAPHRPTYGYGTGVGANLTTLVTADHFDRFGRDLLRAHSGGFGPLLPAPSARAMMAVRLNQLLRAGTAVGRDVVQALASTLARGHVPEVHTHGSIGTADLSALAELALTLSGELPWMPGEGDGASPAPVRLSGWDALPLMSSSALTIGRAALALEDLRVLLDSIPPLAALVLLAVHGSLEPFDVAVHRMRPHAGAAATAARMRALIPGPTAPGSRVQDRFGLRALPQVHGAAVEAFDTLEAVLCIEINAAAENPLLVRDGPDGAPRYVHHGGFHQARLALALDHLRLALVGTAELSAARLAEIFEPSRTGVPPFLAQSEDGSSGLMILEYGVQSALAQLRSAAQPATLNHSVVSRGDEDHASFAPLATTRLEECVELLRLVLAVELVAATRALRMQQVNVDAVGSAELVDFAATAAKVLDPGTEDRNLTEDVHAVARACFPAA